MLLLFQWGGGHLPRRHSRRLPNRGEEARVGKTFIRTTPDRVVLLLYQLLFSRENWLRQNELDP